MDSKVEHGEDLVRLHERWMTLMEKNMDNTNKRVNRVESNVNKIPWILLGVIVSSLFSIVNLVILLATTLKAVHTG